MPPPAGLARRLQWREAMLRLAEMVAVRDSGRRRLPAKLRRPGYGDAVDRPRLHATLDELTRKPLTWLQAPAGAGKTTLIAAYAARRAAPVLWYTLDDGDADPSSLSYYLGEAARALGVELRLPPASRGGSRRFFEALLAALPASTLLVFDDYHEAAHAAEWHQLFRELCRCLTEQQRVVVASRSSPPAALMRFLAAGTLSVLAADELRLDASEVEAVLRRSGQAAGAPERRAMGQRLLALTQGWAAGVALLARASSAGRGLEGDGSLAPVFDYLANEVVDRLEPATQAALSELALFPSFSANMAAELTGRRDMPELLARLHADQLLLERQGDSHYRLHDLLRRLLLERGRATHTDHAWRGLQSRATFLLADYCCAGSVRCLQVADEALATVAGHGNREDRLLTLAAASLAHLLSGHTPRARELCKLAEAAAADGASEPLARLAYLRSGATISLWCDGDFAACQRAVDEGLLLGRACGIDAWHGSLLMLGVLGALAAGDLQTAQGHLQAMSELAPLGPRLARAQYAFGRGWLALEQGRTDEALIWVRESLREHQLLGFPFAAAECAIAEVVCEVSRHAQRATIEAALARADELLTKVPSSAVVSAAHLARAYALLELGEDATDALRRGLSSLRRHDLRACAFFGRRVISRLLTAALASEIENDLCQELSRVYRLRPGPEALTSARFAWPLRLRALGPLAIELEQRPLTFGKKKPTVPLALLKLLALEGEPIPVRRLARALWPAYDEAAARAALDTALYRLRKLLIVPDAVASIDGCVGLCADAVWSDARALGQCLRELEAPGTDAAALERCERALLDLKPRALPDEGEPLAVQRAEQRVQRRYVQAVEALAKQWDRAGRRERSERLTSLIGQQC
jgi:hypothetical protein